MNDNFKYLAQTRKLFKYIYGVYLFVCSNKRDPNYRLSGVIKYIFMIFFSHFTNIVGKTENKQLILKSTSLQIYMQD